MITLDNQPDVSGIAAVNVGRLTDVEAAVLSLDAANVQIEELAVTGRRRQRQLETIHLVDELIEPPPVDGQRLVARHFAAEKGLGAGGQDGPTGVDPDFGRRCDGHKNQWPNLILGGTSLP